MKSVRVEQGCMPGIFLVDVICSCGRNGLKDEASGEASVRHEITVGGEDKLLCCQGCGRKFRLHPQRTHVHIISE